MAYSAQHTNFVPELLDKYRNTTPPVRSTLNLFDSYSPTLRDKDYHPYISGRNSAEYALNKAITIFKTLNEGKSPKTFLDLGCGKGGILYLAKKLGLQPTGVEYSNELIAVGKQCFKHLKMRSPKFISGDILEFVPDKKYDIVYFFRPIIDEDKWRSFLNHVADVFPKGQLIVSFFSMYGDIVRSKYKAISSGMHDMRESCFIVK